VADQQKCRPGKSSHHAVDRGEVTCAAGQLYSTIHRNRATEPGKWSILINLGESHPVRSSRQSKEILPGVKIGQGGLIVESPFVRMSERKSTL
jgi:hypothetical protein